MLNNSPYPCTYAKRLNNASILFFVAIDETRGNAIESSVNVIDLIVGDSFRRHEFHHSSVGYSRWRHLCDQDYAGAGIKEGGGGITVENTLAGYAYLRARSYLRFAGAFVDVCL